jgi:hypothetical protein
MLQFSPTGWVAHYESRQLGATYRQVESWAADGSALVVDHEQAKLVLAASLPDFAGLGAACRLVDAVAAAPGWYQRTRVLGRNEPVIDPVAVWLVTDHGNVFPVGRNDGLHYLAPGGDSFRQRVDIFYEPAQAPEQPSGGVGLPDSPTPPVQAHQP